MIKHVTFFASDCGIHIHLSDLNKNIGGFGEKRHGSADLHTRIHPPHIRALSMNQFYISTSPSARGDVFRSAIRWKYRFTNTGTAFRPNYCTKTMFGRKVIDVIRLFHYCGEYW